MSQRSNSRERVAVWTLVLFGFAGGMRVYAGNLDSPAAPTDSGSAMYTLEDLYNRLNTGTVGAQSVFAEPTAGPGSTGHTLNQIMTKAPALDANGAGAAEVLTGKTYWGLLSGAWGQQTGTMLNRGAVTLTPGTTQQAIQQGYHNGSGYVEGDADLVTGNIRSGVNIFGVAGDVNVVNTVSGDATAPDILASKKVWVDGAEVTGTMPNNGAVSITPGTSVQAIAAGYHNGSGSVAGDANLVTGNIKAGKTIFGVSGKTEVVDTSSGTAVAGDLLSGKKVWVGGTEVTGTVPAGGNLNGSDGSLVITITDGLYTGSKTATANDTDLATGNVRSGVNIFGVAGDANVVNTSSGDATAADVLATKKAWVDGVEVTGSMATRTLSSANDTVQAGYYAATTLSAVDSDLASGNIRAGVTVFGVAGDANVVNTSSGDATAGDMLATKKAWIDGTEVTGTMPNNGAVSITPGISVQAIAAGYHNGSGSVAGDANLVTGNIKAGANIFGVSGKTEVVDTSSGTAVAGDLLSGKKAWIGGTEVTGTVPTGGNLNGGDGALVITITDGLYTASKTATANDTDLATGNIRSGVNIFGVAGDVNVVNTVSGDATAADILTGKKVWVDGAEVTGTMATRTLSAANDTVQAGYYAATTLSAVDTDLATANIKAGTTIFGVAGKTEVVDTTSGDAVAADIATGKKAWVDGAEVTGTASGSAYPAQVAKSGAGDLPSYTEVAGEDGHASMRKGVAWPNPRFTDNSNGTITDNLTGLIWLKNANFKSGTRTWAQALTDCATLNSGEGGLTDGSVEGDWRLPNVQELQSLIDYGRSNPALCNTAGTGQWTSGNPFTGVQSSYYWSGTTYAGTTAYAWNVYLGDGYVNCYGKSNTYYVWPVRGP